MSDCLFQLEILQRSALDYRDAINTKCKKSYKASAAYKDKLFRDNFVAIVELFSEFVNNAENNYEDYPEEIANALSDVFLFEGISINEFPDANLRTKLGKVEDSTLLEGVYKDHEGCIQFKNCAIKTLNIYKNTPFVRFWELRCLESEIGVFRNVPSGLEGVHNIYFHACKIVYVSIEGAVRSNLYFYDCTVVRIYLKKAVMDRLGFHNCTLGSKTGDISLSFENCKMQEDTAFINCKFLSSPSFHGTLFHSDTIFKGGEYRLKNSKYAENRYRVIKGASEQIGAMHQAQFFHALELDARLRNNLPKLSNFRHAEWPLTFCSTILKGYNYYGNNYWKPILCLFLLFFLCFCLYLLPHALVCNGSNIDNAEIWQRSLCIGTHNHIFSNKYLAAFIYSLQHSLGPLGLIIENGLISAKTGWIKTLSIFQITVSSIFWYLIIVQIRRQFKL